MYKPLPESVTIKKSKINGLGLFATRKIEANKTLGVSHVKSGPGMRSAKTEDGYWRTPLGGFINHSNNPNCIKEENRFTGNLFLRTKKIIKEGEELTVKYTLYNVEIKKLFNTDRNDPFKEGTD
tara:strand:- start:1158 stop:1529 length:372 start_codon:yes stop_codon:yes gene_type:complete